MTEDREVKEGRDAKTAVVICPGRGVYNRGEFGYLRRHHADKAALFEAFDTERERLGQETLAALDNTVAYSVKTHTRGDNASALIYAATIGDFLSIDRERIDIVAVTGNSMGWYSALACAGALSPEAGFLVVNTMGTLMQESLIGGQLIYPFVSENWLPDPGRKAELLALIAEIGDRSGRVLSLSIDLGGMLVLAGNEAGLAAFEAAVPAVQGRFPMRLSNHAAFHSALQAPVAERARARLPAGIFERPALASQMLPLPALPLPALPLVDGCGAIWWPGATEIDALWEYTLGQQVTETYDFTRAIAVAAREFAPDLFLVTGPGTTLGSAVAQSLILANWKGMSSRQDFKALQAAEPFLVAMGMEEQRAKIERP